MSNTRFVILSQPRTGSTLLCSLFSSHPKVRCLVEPINPRNHTHHMKALPESAIMPEVMIQNNIQRALKILFSPEPVPEQWIRSRKRGDVAAGFKIMAHQITSLKSEKTFWEYLSAEKIKVVLCFRYNILMQHISDMITLVTRQSACWDGQIRTAKAMINTTTLGRDLKKLMDEKQYLIGKAEEYNLTRRRIKYEDFKDDVTVASEALHWIIGEHRSLTTKLSKQNPDSIRDRVHNYVEVATEVRRLGLGHLLDETIKGA